VHGKAHHNAFPATAAAREFSVQTSFRRALSKPKRCDAGETFNTLRIFGKPVNQKREFGHRNSAFSPRDRSVFHKIAKCAKKKTPAVG
jgi:hypothetical protein